MEKEMKDLPYYKENCQMALFQAKLSPCNKRKVGAVIVDSHGLTLSKGFNCNGFGPCEDSNGNTFDTVLHAEIAAIDNVGIGSVSPYAIYVTHPPCDNCAKAIKDFGITNIVIVEDFMKFDSGKLRYGLIPPSATKALASVLTYGAKKYKPNNWQSVDDTSRYVDALYRHLESWRGGEKLDSESGLPHLAHALTNISFLIHFEDDMDSRN